MKYRKPVYSEETKRGWAEAERRAKEFAEKHSEEIVKDFEIANFVVRCIQRKYDACMKKENEYGIQVWMQKPESVSVEELAEACVYNKWFSNPEKANNEFRVVKAMLL